MKTQISVALVSAVAISLSGCGAAGGVISGAQGAYGAARTYATATNAAKMAKDLKNAVPAFEGFDAAVTVARIAPRDEDASANLASMFEQNMVYLVNATASATGAPLRGCPSRAACSGKLMVLQFIEDDYSGNIVEKFTLGSKLRGRLSYIDADSGQIVYEQRIEAADNYGHVMQAIKAQLSTTLLRSFPADDLPAITDRLETIEPVAPQYAALSEAS